jgi:BirA family biotin operon repressor/biotin-[acetyl-CoA-carboxylase] ligase
MMTMGLLQVERIKNDLRSVRIGQRIEYVETTTSTNDEAWTHVASGDADGLVVLTEHQSVGRGRLGRKWESPRGASVLLSIVLVESEIEQGAERARVGSELRAHRLQTGATQGTKRARMGGEIVMRSAIAVCDAIRECTDVPATIRWPNDLYIAGNKVGGILVESQQSATGGLVFVIGIGINCLQHAGHLQVIGDRPVTSLDLEAKHPVDRSTLVAVLLEQLDARFASLGDGADARQAWLDRAEPVGRPVRLQHGGQVLTGSVMDIDPAAALVVQLDEGGIRAFDASTTTML